MLFVGSLEGASASLALALRNELAVAQNSPTSLFRLLMAVSLGFDIRLPSVLRENRTMNVGHGVTFLFSHPERPPFHDTRMNSELDRAL